MQLSTIGLMKGETRTMAHMGVPNRGAPGKKQSWGFRMQGSTSGSANICHNLHVIHLYNASGSTIQLLIPMLSLGIYLYKQHLLWTLTGIVQSRLWTLSFLNSTAPTWALNSASSTHIKLVGGLGFPQKEF